MKLQVARLWLQVQVAGLQVSSFKLQGYWLQGSNYTMKSYRDLDVYLESKIWAIKVHKMTLLLPKFEMYEEGSQIRRCAKAVTSLIVEGYGRRRYKADFIKYLVYAHAECDETIVHLDFLFETTSLTDSNLYEEIKNGYSLLSRKINNFIYWVENNLNDFTKPGTSNL